MKIFPISSYSHPTSRNTQEKQKLNNNFFTGLKSVNSYRANIENYKANFLNNISFEGINRKQSNFELKTIEGLDCPCCGEVMLTPKQQREFICEVCGKKGKQLEEVLLSANQFYNKVEKEAVSRIITVSRAKPNLNLQEIVKLESQRHKKPLEKKQMAIIEKIRNASKNLKPEVRAEIKELLDESIYKIKFSTDDDHFKRGDIITGIIEIESKRGKEPAFKDLHKFATELPSTHTNVDAFFVKFARKSERDIAERLTKPSLVTTEHINPQANNGSNSTDNYIPMCSSCNALRSNTPYPIWLKLHPEMKENLQNFINTIYEKIKNKEFNGSKYYDTYVDDVIRAFARETGGELVLQRPDNMPVDMTDPKKKPKLSPEEKRQKMYDEAMSLYDRVRELKQLKEDLKDDDEFHMIVEHSRLSEVLRQLLQDKKAKSIALTEQKRAVATAENSLSKATKDKEKEKKIKAAQEKVEVEKAKLDEAKAAYNEAAKIADQKGIELEKLAKKMTFPGDVQKQIEKIEGNLAQMRSLLIKIGSFETHALNQYQIRNLIHDIQDEIEQRERERELLSQKVDLNSPENISSKKKYTKLKTRLDMIDGVNPDEFKRLFKGFSEEPSFILKLARKPVQDELNELVNSSNAARYVHMGYVIDDLKKDISQKEVEVQAARDREYELYKLKSQYNALKVHGSEDVLNKKLEGLRAKKAILDKKFGAINIDEQIEMAETRANELMQKYTESL